MEVGWGEKTEALLVNRWVSRKVDAVGLFVLLPRRENTETLWLPR